MARTPASTARTVAEVTITVLHGRPHHWMNLQDAITYLEGYRSNQPSQAPAIKHEVDVRYSNGDVVNGLFHDKAEAVRFLRAFV